MSGAFSQLIDDAVEEIRRREPAYFTRFPIALPPPAVCVARYLPHPLFQGASPGELEAALTKGVARCRSRGVRFTDAGGGGDPVAGILLDSIMDAFAAEQGRVPLRPAPRPEQEVEHTLTEAYDEGQTGDGRRYFVGRQGDRPLLLINALGIPLSMWSKLLADRSHRFRIVVAESRCGEIVRGGMRSDADLMQHAADLADVLDRASIDQVEVLAWCNGGRVAIDLASRCRGRVRSLVLLSTTLRGVQGVAPAASPFEDNLQQLFKSVATDPRLAGSLCKMLGRLAKWPDWDTVAGDPVGRAVALFRLPAKEQATALLTPMSSGEFLLNYGRRTAADEAYPIHEAISALDVPLLVITGDHDGTVSNALILSALRAWGGKAMHASIGGAGHYVNDLQYPYLRWLLERSPELIDHPVSTARVSVAPLGACRSVSMSGPGSPERDEPRGAWGARG